MQEFANKVTVITGAASGIGMGLAKHAASEGMHLVLADLDEGRLQSLASELAATGAKVIAVRTDVSIADDLAALADAAYEKFGQVDLLVNNAGIMLTGFCWERSIEHWQRIININLMGVVHGLHHFVPRMLEQNTPGHIVNTSSQAGLLVAPLMGPYTVSKQAVVALAETLHYELASINAPIKTSVLCPGPIATGIADSGNEFEQNSPASHEASDQLLGHLNHLLAQGMSPADCAKHVFQCIRNEQFWIFTHEDFKPSYQCRVDSIMASSNPEYQLHIPEI